MVDIVLKDLYGDDQTYSGVEKVKLNTSDGGTQIFSKGDVIENVPVALDFTEGDQTIYAPEGYLVKSAIIQKPETLKSENIVKGVEIAGIVGTSEGGGDASEGKFENDILPLQTVSGFEEGIGCYIMELPNDISINADETYYVEWGGTTYTCKGIAKSNGSGNYNYVFLGNGSPLWQGDNDVPFTVLKTLETGETTIMVYSETNETLKIRIYEKCALPLGYELKEIVPKTPLTFAVGNSTLLPNTPTAILADSTAITDMDYISDGESGLVIWDGGLYAVYAGSRTSPLLQASWGTTTMTILGTVGNMGIPSAWYGSTVVADTKKYGSSTEPFLIIANSYNGFQVAIPEDSTEFTHTLQMFKFVK